MLISNKNNITLDLERPLPRPRRPDTSCEQITNRTTNNISQLTRFMANFLLFPRKQNSNSKQLTHWPLFFFLRLMLQSFGDDCFWHQIQSANVTINGISSIFSLLWLCFFFDSDLEFVWSCLANRNQRTPTIPMAHLNSPHTNVYDARSTNCEWYCYKYKYFAQMNQITTPCICDVSFHGFGTPFRLIRKFNLWNRAETSVLTREANAWTLPRTQSTAFY